MSNLNWKRKATTEGHYVAIAPEGQYKITTTRNGLWTVRTPFGKKHIETLQEAKRTAERIRFNCLRETPKGHR